VVDATTNANTSTAGLLDLNISAGNAAVDGINTSLTVNDLATAGTDFEAEVITLTANDADADLFGVVISSAATTNAAAGSYEALLRLSNAENTAGAVTDGLLITTTSATDADITDAIDVSAPDIANALNIGSNPIVTGNTAGTIGDSTTDSWTLTTDGTGSGEVVLPDGSINTAEVLDDTLAAADIAANAIAASELADDAVDEAALKMTNSPTDEYILTYESTTGDFEWEIAASLGTISVAYSDITAPTADTTIAFATYTNTWTVGAIAADAFTISQTGNAGAIDLVTLSGADADLTSLLRLTNSAAVTQADGLLLEATDASGVITDGIDASDAELVNALNMGPNTLLGTTAVLDFTDFDVSADGILTFASDTAGDQITITAPAGDHQALVVDASTNANTST
ncbi:MAG: Uncharacterized protein FD129_2218, partial [bacterium]